MPKEPQRPSGPSLPSDFERGFTQSLEQGLARTVWTTVFQRDAQKGVARTTGQSLQVYEPGGQLSNPASDAAFLENLHSQTADLIRESTSGMSQEDAQTHLKRMGRVLPDLVKALVLDDDYITDIYKPDLISVAAIAVDWFSHPEKVSATRFRIGVGGEELVNGRIPSYIVPALKTLEGVRDAFHNYTLWAINDQLHARIPKSEGDPIGEWIQQKLGEKQSQTQKVQAAEPITLQDVPYEEALRIMGEGWQHFLGETLDIAGIQRVYHSTDQLPELVVFNPSHAAININHMDPRKVINAREQAQALLKGYVERFHPDLSSKVVFQNDRPWDQHDFATRMQILFARDLVRSFNGDREKAQQRIEEFGRHHQKFLGETIMGMSPSELYAMLHPFFFEDPPVTIDPTQRIPGTKVMQPLPIARHVAYHQGAPEIEFGIFRKLYTQNATIDAFSTWLERRALVAEQQLDTLAAQILDTARTGVQRSGKPFISNLFPAINALVNQQQQLNDDQRKELNRILQGYATSDRIKRADDPESAWNQLVQELQAARPEEKPDKLRSLKANVLRYKESTESRRDEINLANLTGNKARLAELSEDEVTERMYYPLTHLENVIRVGAGGPVYYVVEGADSIVYPQLEPVSLDKYTSALDSANDRQSRLRKSTQTITRLFIPQETNEPVTPLPEGLVTEDWQRRWVDRLKDLYTLTDVQEASGVQVTVDALRQEVTTFEKEMLDDLGVVAGINVSGNADLTKTLRQQTFPAISRTAMEETLREGAAQIFRLNSIRQDYLLMLNDINPADPAIAEREYNEFLRGLLGPRRGRSRS